MKIGFVIDDGLDRPDGVQQYVLSLGAQLVKKGHEVVYLAGETKRAPKNIMVYSLTKNLKVTFNGNKLSVPLLANKKQIKKILSEEKFDVLHVQIPHSPFMAARVVKEAYKNTVIIGTFHILPYGFMNKLAARLLGLLLRNNLKKFDRIISVSKPAANFAKNSFKIDSNVIPNMVNIQQFKGSGRAKNNELKMLFVGRLVQRKGCMQLVKAMAILKNDKRLPQGIKLDICGDGDSKDELIKYVSSHDLSDNIQFHGFISNEEKIKYMQNAHISIFPSLSGESFGIVLIEAMAAGGGIVLGGNNPGYGSVLGEIPESIIEVENENKMATTIADLMHDTKKRDEIYNLQQAHVEQFDSPVVASSVIHLYEACINERNNK